MSAILSRADIPKLLEPTLSEVWQFHYDLGGSQYDKIYKMKTSIKAKEEVAETVIPMDIPQVNEGGQYVRGELLMGRSKVFQHLTFKLELVQTEEVAEDNLYEAAMDQMEALGSSTKRTIEKRAAIQWANTLGSELTPDGKPVFAPDHPVLYPNGVNPTSWSNILTGLAMGSDAMKRLKILIRKSRDERGELAPNYKIEQLICAVDMGEELEELIGSPGTYDRADRAKNQAGSGLGEIVKLDHLTDSNVPNIANVIFGRDKRMAKNSWYWRVKPQFKTIYEEATGNLVHRVRFRYSSGFPNPRGLVAMQVA